MVARSVSVDKVEVLEFARTLGDNPSVSAGVPVALDARILHKEVLPLDDYEMGRRPRRDPCNLMIHRSDREDM